MLEKTREAFQTYYNLIILFDLFFKLKNVSISKRCSYPSQKVNIFLWLWDRSLSIKKGIFEMLNVHLCSTWSVYYLHAATMRKGHSKIPQPQTGCGHISLPGSLQTSAYTCKHQEAFSCIFLIENWLFLLFLIFCLFYMHKEGSVCLL